MTTRRAHSILLLPAFLLALLGPVPAQAAEEIGLSRDGVTWTPELAVPLLEPERRWVPGDDETRTFRLRNQGPSEATMSIEALSPGGDRLLEADVAFSVRVDGGPWIPLELGVAEQNVTVQPLEVGRGVPVEIRAVFDPASANPTQNLVLPLTLRITLSGDVPPADAGDSGGAGPVGSGGAEGDDGLLPGTGSTVGLEILLAAVALCLLGALVIARRSFREEERHG